MEERKFDLYFAGNMSEYSEARLRYRCVDRLASQLLDRKAIADWIAYEPEEGKYKGKLFIDSGAFSAHTRGAEVDVDEYIEYINSIDEHVHVFAQVDKIPGVFRQPKTDKQLAEAPKQTWDNYLYMRERVISPDKLMPIHHQGDDYKWLHNMLEWVDDAGKHIPYIGISPANDQHVSEKEEYIDDCFRIIEDSPNPNVQTHAFGMTTLDILERYPFTSADSTSWVLSGACGNIMTETGTILLSSGSESTSAHFNRMPEAVQDSIKEYVSKYGYCIEDLQHNYKARVCFNIDFLDEWSRNYTPRFTKVRRRKLI